MDLNTLQLNIKKRITEVNDLIKTEGKNALGAAFKELFDKFPELNRIRWTQYTPYFNDGDACTFRVGEWYLDIDKDHLKTLGMKSYKGDEEICDYYTEDYIGDGFIEISFQCKKLKTLTESISPIFKIEDDIFEKVFGDHSEIIVSRDGFDVEEWDHD